MKLFDWRVTWTDYQMVANNVVMPFNPMVWLKIKPLPLAECWLPGKDKSGKLEVTTDLPLWKGKKNVTLILFCCRAKKDIERWHLKDAEVDGKIISYQDVEYESCYYDKQEESATENCAKP